MTQRTDSACGDRRSPAFHRGVPLLGLFLGFGSFVFVAPNRCGAEAKIAEYAGAIRLATDDLNAGRIAEARRRLDATQMELRGFEFDLLSARAEQNAKEGTSASDLVRKLPKPEVEVRYGVLNETNRELVYICRDGGLRIYDLKAPETKAKTVAHPQGSSIWTGAFSHDGKTFCSGHENGEVLVWDAASWEKRHTISVGTNWPVRELAVGPDGSFLVAESQKELELWSLAGGEPKKVAGVGQTYNFGEGLAISPRGDLLATGGMFDIQFRDARTGELLRSARHASYTRGLEFSPDGKRIVSASRGNVNRFLALFDVTQEKALFNVGPFGNYIAGTAFSPDGKRIAATGCEKVLRIFESETGEIVLSIPRPECGAKPAFSRDGRLLGWTEPDGYRFIELSKKGDEQKQR